MSFNMVFGKIGNNQACEFMHLINESMAHVENTKVFKFRDIVLLPVTVNDSEKKKGHNWATQRPDSM